MYISLGYIQISVITIKLFLYYIHSKMIHSIKVELKMLYFHIFFFFIWTWFWDRRLGCKSYTCSFSSAAPCLIFRRSFRHVRNRDVVRQQLVRDWRMLRLLLLSAVILGWKWLEFSMNEFITVLMVIFAVPVVLSVVQSENAAGIFFVTFPD